MPKGLFATNFNGNGARYSYTLEALFINIK